MCHTWFDVAAHLPEGSQMSHCTNRLSVSTVTWVVLITDVDQFTADP